MYGDELISVIVPVYNSEKYVRQTLDSVIGQTYGNLEILVVDDGSTDRSGDICDEYLADHRVKVFHKQNEGVAASRQFGIDRSKGAYLATIDSDDYVSAEFIEKLYRAIKTCDADVSVCGVSCFLDGRRGITTSYMPVISGEKLTVTKELLATDFSKIARDLILTDSWNKMYRAQFVRDTNVKYRLDNIYNGSELQFNHKLALHCPTYCVCREYLLFHRNHSGSRVLRKDKPLQEGFEIITDSLIEESRAVGVPIKSQLSDIYYGLIGMVVLDIHYHGGGIGEQHKRYRSLIEKNKRFLADHRETLDARKGLEAFQVSRFSLPSFILGNALWLDSFSLVYGFLRRASNALRRA